LQKICEGLKVVELGAGSIAASMTGMLLADVGARVIKVEPPGGDRLRTWNAPGFAAWNRGKESYVLDLHLQQQRDRALALMAAADVVIEAFAPSRAEKWGLGYEAIAALNPGLIYCRIKGFGVSGPLSHLKSHEGVIAAKVGLYNRGGFAFREGPIYLNAPLTSTSAGHHALGGIVAALLARLQTGRGQLVDATMYAASTAFDYGWTPRYQIGSRNSVLADDSAPAVSPKRSGEVIFGLMTVCSSDDAWFCLVNLLPHQASALARACGMADLLENPRFARTPTFACQADALDYEERIMRAFRNMTAEDIQHACLAEADIAFERIRRTDEAFSHPQVINNRCAIELTDKREGKIRMIGPIAEFSNTPAVIDRAAPALGEHDDILWDSADLLKTATDLQAVRSHAPLSGITIIELAYFFAVPYGVTLAAALGARVIKVEGKDGDPWRYRGTANEEVASAQCLQGKESIALDLKSGAGREILTKLVRKADAFVYGLRQDPVTLGADYQSLVAHNRDLVYIQCPGYGADGPYAGRPMYANTGDALGGFYMRNCGYWLTADKSQGFDVDVLRGLQVAKMRGNSPADGHCAGGIFSTLMLSLLAKARLGHGQRVICSMINNVLYGYSDDFVEYSEKPGPALADPQQLGLHPLYRLYKAADNWIFVAATTDREWTELALALGKPGLLSDEMFASHESRTANAERLAAIVAAELAREPADFWEQRLNASGVGCAVCSDGPPQQFTSTNPELLRLGLTRSIMHPTLGELITPGPPVILSQTPGDVSPGTVFGQNTRSILKELGYSTANIESIIKGGHAFGPLNAESAATSDDRAHPGPAT
jgi:crotonobetainyl-CoA:carnitine CoA-transferase CaiB-like acyl-CoA transferase